MTDALSPFTKRAADALADAVASLIERGIIGSRSPAGDALLDYRDPPQGDRKTQKLNAVAAAAKQVHELHERTLCEHNITLHHSMDVAWDALTKALKDLG